MSARSEHPCSHYGGLKRAHCYRCLGEDRDAEAYERHVNRTQRDPWAALVAELLRKGRS